MRAIACLICFLAMFYASDVFALGEHENARLTACFERLGDNATMIENALRAEELPCALIYLACAESGGKSDAVSKAGAVGVWQLMPRTARKYGLHVDAEYDERLDVEKSTRAAVAYLAHLSTMFHGDLLWIVAAYSAGGHNLLRSIGGHERGMRIGIIKDTYPAAYALAMTVQRASTGYTKAL